MSAVINHYSARAHGLWLGVNGISKQDNKDQRLFQTLSPLQMTLIYLKITFIGHEIIELVLSFVDKNEIQIENNLKEYKKCTFITIIITFYKTIENNKNKMFCKTIKCFKT